MGLPTNWNRSLTVTGLGVFAIWLIDALDMLFNSGAVFDAFTLFETGELSAATSLIASFMAVFLALVVGELFVILGQQYKLRKLDAQKMHAMALFCEEVETGYWGSRFLVASNRDELLSGLMAIFAICGVGCMLNLLVVWSLIGLFSGAGMLLLAFFCSALISSVYGEIEKIMSELSTKSEGDLLKHQGLENRSNKS